MNSKSRRPWISRGGLFFAAALAGAAAVLVALAAVRVPPPRAKLAVETTKVLGVRHVPRRTDVRATEHWIVQAVFAGSDRELSCDIPACRAIERLAPGRPATLEVDELLGGYELYDVIQDGTRRLTYEESAAARGPTRVAWFVIALVMGGVAAAAFQAGRCHEG